MKTCIKNISRFHLILFIGFSLLTLPAFAFGRDDNNFKKTNGMRSLEHGLLRDYGLIVDRVSPVKRDEKSRITSESRDLLTAIKSVDDEAYYPWLRALSAKINESDLPKFDPPIKLTVINARTEKVWRTIPPKSALGLFVWTFTAGPVTLATPLVGVEETGEALSLTVGDREKFIDDLIEFLPAYHNVSLEKIRADHDASLETSTLSEELKNVYGVDIQRTSSVFDTPSIHEHLAFLKDFKTAAHELKLLEKVQGHDNPISKAKLGISLVVDLEGEANKPSYLGSDAVEHTPGQDLYAYVSYWRAGHGSAKHTVETILEWLDTNDSIWIINRIY